jgi:hypothetical protein
MTNEDEMLLESRFPSFDLEPGERNFYLSLLALTKEVESSTRVVDPSRPLASFETLPDSEHSIFIDEDDSWPIFSSIFSEKGKKQSVPKKKVAPTPFEMITMVLRKNENGTISFNGAIGNNIESKWIDGLIEKLGKRKYNITTNVYRLYEHLRDSEKMYRVEDDFCLLDDKTLRETHYYDHIRFELPSEAELPALTPELQDEFVDGLLMKLEK